MAKKFGSMEVFYPAQLFDIETLDRVIENTLEETAEAVRVELSKITQTWKNRPRILIHREKYARLINADRSNKAGQVFDMLEGGTKKNYPITARNAPRLRFRHPGFVAKTSPRKLTSGAGKPADGPIRMPVQVIHPGIEAREWYDETQKKWDAELPTQMQRAIDASVSRMGKRQVRK